jgi:hypothetical protein
MSVRATDLVQQADRRFMQDQLPALVRRLILATADVDSVSFPSGESVQRPGFDGRLIATSGNPWVPDGSSAWEMGCNRDPRRKAEDDYEGRRPQADDATTFIFVTPRRWSTKGEWEEARRAEGIWRDVRVLDADDLEAWLESAPGVGLWLSELCGIAGAGVHSVESWWARWATQTAREISHEALFTGREEARESLVDLLERQPAFIGIRADSAEEAAAFACASLLMAGRQDAAAVISDVAALRWVDANPRLSAVVASTSDIGAAWRAREGVTLIVPSNPSRAGRPGDSPGEEVALPRVLRSDFEDALVSLGHDPADAARLARNTGRSWSIYRRVEARNPAIAHPGWLDRPAVRSLTTLCLIGAWNAAQEGDTAIVERIAGRSYAEVERELRELSAADDSPVLRIRDVWMALSPIELLHLVGPRITGDELDRFYSEMEALLSERDPVLDLEPEQRWAASSYGKRRAASGLLIDGMADSLVKLSVVGDLMGALASARPSTRATLLVRRLLSDAGRDRWLSLSNVLRELAEAAPEEFLLQLEAGLQRGDDGPIALILETGSAGPGGGGCWHADLLWALELLAWSPRRLVKVATLLAAMVDVPIAGNWANTPLASLASLFRSWWPQTAADERGRIAAIDRLMQRNPESAWKLLVNVGSGGGSFASPNAHPQWRVDDLGFTRPPANRSPSYERAIRERLIAAAAGQSGRLADLIREFRSFGTRSQATILDHAAALADRQDDEREVLRAALRKHLWWENSFNSDGSHGVRPHHRRIERLYEALAPRDLVVRHKWLFAADWIEPPEGHGIDDDGERRADVLRRDAVREIFEAEGWPRLLALALASAQPHLVGWALARLPDVNVDPNALVALLTGTDVQPSLAAFLRGYLAGLPEDRLRPLLDVLEARPEIAGKSEHLAGLLLKLPATPLSWCRADQASGEVRDRYWRAMVPRISYDPPERLLVLSRLREFERPRTALALAQFKPEEIEPQLILELLTSFASGQEPDGPLLDQWRIARILKRLEDDEAVDRNALAHIEWALFPILKHGREGTRALTEQLVNNAELFVQLIEIAYARVDSKADPAAVELARDRASNAHWLLHDLDVLPGTDREARVDPDAFRAWIAEARNRSQGTDRADLCDDRIGSLLAHSPDGSDGIWPHELVREILELPDATIIREGFIVGVRNNRGVTSRAYHEGGDQERRLSESYRAKAAGLSDSWPETAEVLSKLADTYAREAEREDEDARLRIER